MDKKTFIKELEKTLHNYEDKDEIINYYEELIDEAVSSDEDEIEFISKLGTPKQIKETLLSDGSFKEKLKEKKNFQIKGIVSVTAKVLSGVVVGFVAFIMGIIAFSFVVSGVGNSFNVIVRLILNFPTTFEVLMFIISQFLLGIGFLLIGIGIFWYITENIRQYFMKLTGKIDTSLNKRKTV